jgi:hypothetical protein
LLNEPKTSSNARNLNNHFKSITGGYIKVGCMCKQSNVNKVFDEINKWFKTQN